MAEPTSLSGERLAEMAHRARAFSDWEPTRAIVHDMYVLMAEVHLLTQALGVAQAHEAMMMQQMYQRLEAAWAHKERLEAENAWLREYKGAPAQPAASEERP